MPRRNLQSFGGMLADILCEVSVPVKVGVVAGLGLGLAAGFAFANQVPADEARFVGRFPWLVSVGLFLLGGCLGLVAGVVADMLWESMRKPPPKQRGDR